MLAAAGLIGVVFLPPIRYRVFWYAISPTEIDIQHGIVFIKRSVIPMHRVQSLRVERGPIADHYRMTNLRISTAAGTVTVSPAWTGPRRMPVHPDQPTGRRGR